LLGNEQLRHTLGGKNSSQVGANSVRETADGGYIIAGRASSYAGMLVKTDANGNELWTKKYGSGGSVANSVIQTIDGRYIIAGLKDSCSKNSFDFWLIRLEGKR